MNETFHVGDWIHDLAKLLKQETDSTLATMSLGQGQLMLFMFLLRHASDEHCFQEQIAKAMGLNKANVSRNVAKLEQKGLVQITAQDGDARRRQIRLTPQALVLKDELSGHLQSIHLRMVDGIDEQQLAITASVLKRLVANLEASKEHT
jgi:DNA-binding MarR family transcriptional regulator